MPVKQLPVHMNPGLETECYHNFRLSIIMSDPDRLPWCYSRFVNLQIQSKEKMQCPFVRFEEHLDIYSGLLLEEPIDIHHKDWMTSIREAINQDQYVIIYLNWKHIRGSNFYNGSDLVHDAIIYGYNDEERMLDLLAFEVLGKSYGTIRIPYDICETEFAHVIEAHLHANKWFAYYGFPLSTIRINRCAEVSQDLRCLYFALERGKVRPQGREDDVFANGYYVNEHMAAFFLQLSADRNVDAREYGLWNIVVLKMLQHKKWMLKRLAFMMHAHSGRDDRLLKKSLSLFEKAKLRLMQVRMDALKYQKTSEVHYLEQLSGHFQYIFEQEKRAVPLMMEYLIQTRLDSNKDERRVSR